jgi:hypothetical protein
MRLRPASWAAREAGRVGRIEPNREVEARVRLVDAKILGDLEVHAWSPNGVVPVSPSEATALTRSAAPRAPGHAHMPLTPAVPSLQIHGSTQSQPPPSLFGDDEIAHAPGAPSLCGKQEAYGGVHCHSGSPCCAQDAALEARLYAGPTNDPTTHAVSHRPGPVANPRTGKCCRSRRRRGAATTAATATAQRLLCQRRAMSPRGRPPPRGQRLVGRWRRQRPLHTGRAAPSWPSAHPACEASAHELRGSIAPLGPVASTRRIRPPVCGNRPATPMGSPPPVADGPTAETLRDGVADKFRKGFAGRRRPRFQRVELAPWQLDRYDRRATWLNLDRFSVIFPLTRLAPVLVHLTRSVPGRPPLRQRTSVPPHLRESSWLE